jgi:uncharacterized protein DUF6624
MQRLWRAIFVATVILAGAAQAEDPDASKWREKCPGFSEWEKQQQPDATAQAAPTAAKNPALRAKILRMTDEDQKAREPMTTAGVHITRQQISNMKSVDSRNLKTLKAIIATHGTPTPSLISEDGVQAFWLLIQHADTDPGLQEKVLHDFQDRPAGVRLQDIALLTDRVRVNQHRLQVYGSQFHSEGKEFTARQIQDPEHVDERRKSMNLPPMAVYKCQLRLFYESAVVQ